ncbi:hypothetical protein AAMO2058_001151200 [Amorphochlora amoebiformis]
MIFPVSMTLLIIQLVFVLASTRELPPNQQNLHKGIDLPDCTRERDMVVGSRFWARGPGDLQRLDTFLRNTKDAVGPRLCALLVAVNSQEDTEATTSHLIDMGQAFPLVGVWDVSPWSITGPLNSLLDKAKSLGATFIIFASVEVHIDRGHLDALTSSLDVETLVAGAAMPGHKPMELISPHKTLKCGETLTSKLEGDLIPWNTLSVWRLDKIARLGFLKDADAQDPPGMEEAVPIAMLQNTFSKQNAKAKLIHFSMDYKPSWEVSFESDIHRRAKQARKMASKNRRTDAQLKAVGLQGEVTHIFYCANSSLVHAYKEEVNFGKKQH